MKKKKTLLNFVKIAVTLAGLYLAYGKFDWTQLKTNYQSLDWKYYFLSLGLTIFILLLNSWRLQLISVAKIPFKELVKINFISRFFNLFLPTSIGGDVFRTLSYKKYAKTGTKSFSVIFIDRFIGMTAMISLGTIFLLLPILDKSKLEDWLSYIMIGTFLLVVSIWLFIISQKLSHIAIKIIGIVPFNTIKDKILKLYEEIRQINKVPSADLMKALGSSFLSHFISSSSIYFISEALQLKIPAIQFFITIPIINTLLLLPLSINGIGVRDYLFKNLYEPLTSSTNFILLAPLNFLQTLVTGIIGGIMYIFYKQK